MDRHLNAFWQQALDGDPVAARTVIRVIDQRCRLLGLHQTGSKKVEDGGPAYLVVGPRGTQEPIRICHCARTLMAPERAIVDTSLHTSQCRPECRPERRQVSAIGLFTSDRRA